jgi:Glycosyl hydrolases family 2, sugar binding domain/Glycosyl hydrolases family 2/Glycosyl hydrolases family 2, TIM barrel domain
MERRRFLKDAAQIGVGWGIAGTLSAEQTARATLPEPPPPTILGTPILSLDGQWSIATDPQNLGRAEQWFGSDMRGSTLTRVPGVIQEAFPAYHGVAWYGRSFVAPSNPNLHGRYRLRFDAVDYLADVWVNGVHVGEHEGGETPFVLDVTQAVRPNAENRLIVRVLNPTNEPIDGIALNGTPRLCKIVPFWNGNLYDYGGIIGSVALLMAPAVRVEDLWVRPDWKTGRIRIQATVRNTTSQPVRGFFEFDVVPASGGEILTTARLEHQLLPSDSVVETELLIDNPHLWNLETPFLYRVTARLHTPESEFVDEASVRCGFRDFRVENGYFRLNGKRIFLRSTVTLSHCPVGQRLPPTQVPDLLRRDMLYSKMAGFNVVRIVGIPYPYQLDLCDEIGLMVHESCFASWKLDDSPKMKERYDRSTREMVLRDRNHPSVAIWEMLNETDDGPIFRHAVESLPLVRSLDDTRLVTLSSGRFDCDPSIGSVSNPGGSEWEHVWGKEAPGAARIPKWNTAGYPSTLGSGDFHIYPQVPQTPEVNQFLRTLGHDTKPVFLSEYGTGSQIDAIHEARMYEQVGADPEAEDYVLMRSMAEKVSIDWVRYGLDSAYAFPEDMLRDSQRVMAHYRRTNFDLIRSNPKLCGYSVTGMVDEGMTGGGLWRFWRDWKPETMDAVADGWAPLRWCLFVNPTHFYAGRKVVVEAVLANEDVLRPGDYPARFRICGPTGIVWEQQASVRIPTAPTGGDGPLAISVLLQEISVNGPPGTYEFVANLESGGAPLGRSLRFYLSDAPKLPAMKHSVTLWGFDQKVEAWLRSHGLETQRFSGTSPDHREIILVGDVSKDGSDFKSWKELMQRMAQGSAVVFLSPAAFQRDNDPVAWLPVAPKNRYFRFDDVSIYHKERVAKAHPLFAGLQAKGIMNWDYYGPMIPHYAFDGLAAPSDIAATGFAVGFYGAYSSGVLLGSYRCSVRNDSFTPMGAGMFVVNTFPILENVDTHPAADRLLLNLIDYAAASTNEPLTPLPDDFDAQLAKIGYLSKAPKLDKGVMGAAGPERRDHD